MKQTYIFDTNVLLHNPTSIFEFENSKIIIPISVIDEVDSFKHHAGSLGVHARETARIIDELGKAGDYSTGIDIEETGSQLVVIPCDNNTINALDVKIDDTVDNRLIALGHKFLKGGENVKLLTCDTNLRIKSKALGVPAEEYIISRKEKTNYTGWTTLTVPKETITELHKENSVKSPEKLVKNQYVVLEDKANPKHTTLGRYYKGSINILRSPGASKIKPKNLEQRFAFDALMDDNIKLVTLQGKAGVGKTLLAVAVALQKTLVNKVYGHIVITRPVVPIGKDIGFLPGSLEEKMAPWMKPIMDSIDIISDNDNKGGKSQIPVGAFHDDSLIEIVPLSYIRGRNLADSIIIVDEAQNLTQKEVGTILTRAGHGTKVILTGDPGQIDTPYLSSSNCGLIKTVEKFRDHDIYAHVTLSKCERSELAELAADLFFN